MTAFSEVRVAPVRHLWASRHRTGAQPNFASTVLRSSRNSVLRHRRDSLGSADDPLLAVGHDRVFEVRLERVETGAAVEHVAPPYARRSQVLAVHVIAAPPDPVVAAVAFHGVFARSTIDGVVAVVARQEVVAAQAAYQVVAAQAVAALVVGGADHEVVTWGAPATACAAVEGKRRAAGRNQRDRRGCQ